jgi:hypothetical protein
MTDHEERDIRDCMRLMRQFLDGQIDAKQYTRSYFDLTKERVNIPDEETSMITQQAYGDADDYEADASLRERDRQWIDEVQLKERVAKSFHRLEALGWRI